MNKKKKIILIAAAAVVLIIAAVIGISALVKAQRVKTLISEQNYVASKLIEMGDYEQGHVLALKSEQTKANNIARQLVVLAAGFQADFETAAEYAEAYLEDSEDEILAELEELLEEKVEEYETSGYSYYDYYYQPTLDDSTRQELLAVLLRVQNSIKVKKNVAALQGMIEAYSSGGMSASALAALEGDDSDMARQIRTVFAIDSGDYDAAYAIAEGLFDDNPTFENRALLASLVATGGVGEGVVIDAEDQTELDALYLEQSRIYDELNKLYYSGSDESVLAKQNDLQSQLADVQDKIDGINSAIYSEPVKRAINFIETTTPASERSSDKYKLLVAFLAYYAGQQNKAEEQLLDIFLDESKTLEPVSMMLDKISKKYTEITNTSQRETILRTIWQRVEEIMYLIEPSYSRSENFFDFLQDFLEMFYRGMIIRDIDATDYPTVRVTVNISAATESKLKKSDFKLEDMDEKVSGLKLVDLAKVEGSEELSVMIVVDRSGSMGGTAMTDTKAEVSSFVNGIDASVKLGLVAFESWAELISPLGINRTNLLMGLSGIQPSGGTNIRSGLEVAGQALEGESGRRVIILLSDGADSGSGIDEVLEKLKLQGVIVYTIGFGGADATYLTHIAESCGGKYLSADSSKVLAEIYSTIGESMVNDYILEFKATTDVDDYSRNLRITTDTIRSQAQKEYNVGVSYDSILDEAELAAKFGCFRQVGGSMIN